MTKALDYFKQSLKIYKKTSLNECKVGDVAETLYTIGFCFKDKLKYDKALICFEQSLEIYKKYRLMGVKTLMLQRRFLISDFVSKTCLNITKRWIISNNRLKSTKNIP